MKPIRSEHPRRYSFEEVYERMNNGLCLFCTELDTPGHYQSKHKRSQIFMIEVHDDQLGAENELGFAALPHNEDQAKSISEEILSLPLGKNMLGDEIQNTLSDRKIPGMASRVQPQLLQSPDPPDFYPANPISVNLDQFIKSSEPILMLQGSVDVEQEEDRVKTVRNDYIYLPNEYKCISDRNCSEEKRSICVSRGDRVWEPGGLSSKLEPQTYHADDDMLELTSKLQRTCLQHNTNAGSIPQNFGLGIYSKGLNLWISQNPSQTLGDHKTPYQSWYKLDTNGFNVLAAHEEKMLGVLTSCQMAENFEKLTKSWRFKFKGKFEKNLLTGDKLMFTEESRKCFIEEEGGYSKPQRLVNITLVKSEQWQLELYTRPRSQILQDDEANIHSHNFLEALLRVLCSERQKKFHKTWIFKYKPDFSLRVLLNAEQEQSFYCGDVKQLICGDMKSPMKHKWRPGQLQTDSDVCTKQSSYLAELVLNTLVTVLAGNGLCNYIYEELFIPINLLVGVLGLQRNTKEEVQALAYSQALRVKNKIKVQCQTIMVQDCYVFSSRFKYALLVIGKTSVWSSLFNTEMFMSPRQLHIKKNSVFGGLKSDQSMLVTLAPVKAVSYLLKIHYKQDEIVDKQKHNFVESDESIILGTIDEHMGIETCVNQRSSLEESHGLALKQSFPQVQMLVYSFDKSCSKAVTTMAGYGIESTAVGDKNMSIAQMSYMQGLSNAQPKVENEKVTLRRQLIIERSRNCGLFGFLAQWKWHPPEQVYQSSSIRFIILWTWMIKGKLFSSKWVVIGTKSKKLDHICTGNQVLKGKSGLHVRLKLDMFLGLSTENMTWKVKHMEMGNAKDSAVIFDVKMTKRHNNAVTKVLTLWKVHPPDQATWRLYQDSVNKHLPLVAPYYLCRSGRYLLEFLRTPEDAAMEIMPLQSDLGYVESSFAVRHAYEVFLLQRPPEVLAEKDCISSLRQAIWEFLLQQTTSNSSLRTRMFSRREYCYRKYDPVDLSWFGLSYLSWFSYLKAWFIWFVACENFM